MTAFPIVYIPAKIVSCAQFVVRARGHVTFYADNVYVDRHVRFMPSSWLQYMHRRESQQRSINAVGLAKVYSVGVSHILSCCSLHGMLSDIPSSSSSLLLLLSLCVISRHWECRDANVSVKSYISKIYLYSHISYKFSEIVISASSLLK